MKSLLIICISFTFMLNTQAQWQPLGPFGGNVSALCAMHDTVFAGADNGIFISLNNGDFWQRQSTGLPAVFKVKKIGYYQSKVYAGTDRGLFTYSFTTHTWTSIFDFQIIDFSFTRFNNENLIFVTDGKNIYKRSDKSPWSTVELAWPNESIKSLVAFNNYLAYSSTTNSIKKIDAPLWTSSSPGGTKGTFHLTARNDTLFGAFNFGLYYRTVDTSEWIHIDAYDYTCANFVYADSSDLYVASCRTDFKSYNKKASLLQIVTLNQAIGIQAYMPSLVNNSDMFQTTSDIKCITTNQSFIFIANSEGGVLRWSKVKKTLADAYIGLNNTFIKSIKIGSNSISAFNYNALYVTKKKEQVWKSGVQGLMRKDVFVFGQPSYIDIIEHKKGIFVSTSYGIAVKLFSGTTWHPITNGLPDQEYYKLFSDSNFIYAYAYKNVYKLTNDSIWSPYLLNVASILRNPTFSLQHFVIADNDFQYVSSESSIYYRTSETSPWHDISLPNKTATIVKVIPVGTNIVVYTNKGIYLSNNYGKSYTQTDKGLPIDSVKSVIAIDQDLYASIGTSKIYRSTDFAKSWNVISENLSPEITITDLAGDHDFLYASTNGASVWKYPIAKFYPASVSKGSVSNTSATMVQITGAASANGYATNVSLEYSTDSTFEKNVKQVQITDTLKTNSTIVNTTLSGLAENTSYYYRWLGKNVADVNTNGETNSFTTKPFLKIDYLKSSKFWVLEAIADSLAGNKVTSGTAPVAKVVLNQIVAGTKVRFHFRNFSNSNWKDTALSSFSDTFSIKLPAAAFDAIGMEYYFSVNPPQGFSSKFVDDTISPVKKVSIVFPKGLAFPQKLNTGATTNDYNILSIPLDLADNRPGAILYKPLRLDKPDDTKYRFLTYVGKKGNGNYKDIWKINPESISPGTSYWFAARRLYSPLNTGPGKTVANHPNFDGTHFSISLLPGYNQIANPFLMNISWKDVVEANKNKKISELFGFVKQGDTLTFKAIETLTPFSGGYVKNQDSINTINLLIPSRKNNSNFRIASTNENDFFKINFAIQSKLLRMQLATLGTHENAKPGLDEFDKTAPPVPADFPWLKFSGFHQITTNIVPEKQAGQYWEMEASNVENNTNAILTWEIQNATSGKELWLHDLTAEKITNMKKTTQYSFSGSNRFKIYYGEENYILQNLFPAQQIINIYPSPIGEQAAISFTLPQSSTNSLYTVSYELFDLSGKTLEKTEEKLFSAGFHQINWYPQEHYHGMKFLELTINSSSHTDKYYKKIIFK